MSARPIFHMVNIAKYRMTSHIQIHASSFVVLVGRSMTQKVRLMLKNNSYAYIPVDKLTDLIVDCCPPISDPHCAGKCDFGTGEDCVKCWKSWLMDGEQE